MRYWPEPSVTALRTFSMRAGLAASTRTPGSTAPELSLTIPVIDACARANAGAITNMNTTRRTHWTPRIHPPGRWATAMVEIPYGMRRVMTALPNAGRFCVGLSAMSINGPPSNPNLQYPKPVCGLLNERFVIDDQPHLPDSDTQRLRGTEAHFLAVLSVSVPPCDVIT